MARLLLAAIGATALLALASSASAATTADRQLDAAMKKLVVMKGGPPGAISVVQRGEQRTVHRAGVANLKGRAPLRSTDHMRIASMSKAFSGAVALSLVEKSVLSLDDTIVQRLPSLPAAWGQVTLRQLLDHTSGLPDYTKDKTLLALLARKPHTLFLPLGTVLTYVDDKRLNFAPGSEYNYSNSDNIVVALMAQAATGRTYDELLASEVYAPASLTQTSVPDGFRIPAPYIHGYDLTLDPTEDISTALSMSFVWASGAIISTPDDLTSFIRAYTSRKFFGQATQDQQLRLVAGHSEPIGPGRNLAGLGIFQYTTRCGAVYGHTGNFPGYTQFMAATLDGNRSATFAINTQLNTDNLTRTQRPVFAALRRAEETAVCAALD
jgi:D-alanyl-D-alanine carboxypeptidase